MAIRDYIETHETFTTDDLLDACGRTATNRNLLSRAVAAGKVDRVKSGRYVSRTGRFKGLHPDKYAVSELLFPDAVFAFHSALELHGAAHNIAPRIAQCYADGSGKAEYHGIRLLSWEKPRDCSSVWLSSGHTVTTKNQTLVDCIQHPSRALGVENCMRSIGGLEVDPERCLAIAKGRNKATLVKVAYLLSLMGYEDGNEELFEAVRSQIGAEYYVLGQRRRKAEMAFDGRWRVYAPEETAEWLEG